MHPGRHLAQRIGQGILRSLRVWERVRVQLFQWRDERVNERDERSGEMHSEPRSHSSPSTAHQYGVRVEESRMRAVGVKVTCMTMRKARKLILSSLLSNSAWSRPNTPRLCCSWRSCSRMTSPCPATVISCRGYPKRCVSGRINGKVYVQVE